MIDPSLKYTTLWTSPFPKEVSPKRVTLSRLDLSAPVKISAADAVLRLLKLLLGN
jgi:hypothetical protein